jgi:hypothetical protein
MASVDPQGVITWETGPAVALGFRVNFGVFAGRDVSPREIERLGAELLSVVENVAITAEHRYEFGQRSSGDLQQVRIEIDHDALPPGEVDIEALRGRVADALDVWLRSCLTGFSGQEFTSAELAARDAVVEGVLDEPSPPDSSQR